MIVVSGNTSHTVIGISVVKEVLVEVITQPHRGRKCTFLFITNFTKAAIFFNYQETCNFLHFRIHSWSINWLIFFHCIIVMSMNTIFNLCLTRIMIFLILKKCRSFMNTFKRWSDFFFHTIFPNGYKSSNIRDFSGHFWSFIRNSGLDFHIVMSSNSSYSIIRCSVVKLIASNNARRWQCSLLGFCNLYFFTLLIYKNKTSNFTHNWCYRWCICR